MLFPLLFPVGLIAKAPDAAFQPERARQAAQLAAAAYESQAAIESWSCPSCAAFAASPGQRGAGPQPLTFLANATLGLQAFVGAIDGGATAAVAIRGTVSADWHTWLDDAQIAFTQPWATAADPRVRARYAKVRTHTGFTRCFQAIGAEVLAALRALGYSGGGGGGAGGGPARLMLVGHSSGAAVAALLAFDLAVTHGIAVDELWSLGQPRTGDAAWQTAAGALLGAGGVIDEAPSAAPAAVSWRLTHAKDIIPHVPYEWMEYVHVGNNTREVWYDEPNAAWALCDGSGEDGRCSDSCGDDCLSVSDHLNYVNVTIP
jgi:hypothetical protein